MGQPGEHGAQAVKQSEQHEDLGLGSEVEYEHALQGITRLRGGFVLATMAGTKTELTDTAYAVRAVEDLAALFGKAPRAYAYDRGGYSAENVKRLGKLGVRDPAVSGGENFSRNDAPENLWDGIHPQVNVTIRPGRIFSVGLGMWLCSVARCASSAKRGSSSRSPATRPKVHRASNATASAVHGCSFSRLAHADS